MKKLIEILESGGFEYAIEEANRAIDSLACYMLDLTKLHNNDNMSEEDKTNVAQLIEYIDSLDDNLNHIKGTYESMIEENCEDF